MFSLPPTDLIQATLNSELKVALINVQQVTMRPSSMDLTDFQTNLFQGIPGKDVKMDQPKEQSIAKGFSEKPKHDNGNFWGSGYI